MSRNDPNSLDVLDQMGYPSLDLIAARGWSKAIAPDFPGVGQVVSFCGAVEAAGFDRIDAISINGNEIDRREWLALDPGMVSVFLMEQSYATVVLGGGNKLYLYKDQSDRFVVYFGERELVRSAYSPSWDDADQLFLQWIQDAKFNPTEAATLMRSFNKYHRES